jgi:hypothetical protein
MSLLADHTVLQLVEQGGAAVPFSLTSGQCHMWFVSYVGVSLHIWHLGTLVVCNSVFVFPSLLPSQC